MFSYTLIAPLTRRAHVGTRENLAYSKIPSCKAFSDWLNSPMTSPTGQHGETQMTLTEWTASRKISNRLATLIRQGRATEDQVAEYERRDAEERAFCSLPLRSVPLRNGEAAWFIA